MWGDLVVQQALQGKNRPAAEARGEDNLIRLIREIARQAAREAFDVFREAGPLTLAVSPSSAAESENRPDNVSKANPATEPDDRFLTVADVAAKLAVSQRTVRRMIDRGDLRGQRVGRLVRICSGDLKTISARRGNGVD